MVLENIFPSFLKGENNRLLPFDVIDHHPLGTGLSPARQG
jgi:hypothetical protein